MQKIVCGRSCIVVFVFWIFVVSGMKYQILDFHGSSSAMVQVRCKVSPLLLLPCPMLLPPQLGTLWSAPAVAVTPPPPPAR